MSQPQVTDELRALTRAAIEAGKLPPGGTGRTWAGRGTGKLCAVCRSRIEPAEIEYEVAWSTDEGERLCHFHLACYQIWYVS